MNRILLGGAFGALAMYFLDPQSGRRRRARTRDGLTHTARLTREAGKVTARDAVQRSRGIWAQARSLFSHDDVPDEVLVGRVRSALGRVVSHPHAVDVFVDRGEVQISGPILADEVGPLLACVRGVRGVRSIRNQLTAYPLAGGVPSLQGGVPRGGEHWEFGQDHWAPAARLLAGALGAGLMLRSVRERGLWGALLGAAGGSLLARAVTNYDLSSLVGLGERGVTVEKVIKVGAPLEDVFAFWTDYQNFPRFMSRVRDVQPVADGGSRWLVAGPAGVPVQWTAEVTRVLPLALIEWRASADSDVWHEGSVRFERASNGSADEVTRVTVRLRYVPPAGVFGHAVAALFGADPKAEMDADLMRMKTMIETGHAPHDAARPVPH